MGKAIKWILIGLAGIIVVAVAGIYLVLTGYDFNSLKPRVASAVKEATGRTLNIGGDIELSPGMTPSLTVSDVSFENASWGSRPNLANIKRIEVQVALLPLLEKNIEIKKFILVEPNILVETDKSGKLNVVFDKPAAPAEETKPQKPTGEAPMKLPSLSMEEFVVENGTFVYKDAVSEQTQTVRITKLEARSKGFDSPVTLLLDAVYNETRIIAGGQLGAPSAATDPEKDWNFDLTVSALGVESAIKGKVKDLMTPSGIEVALSANIESFAELNPFVRPLLKMDLPPVAPVRFSANVADTGKMAFAVSDLSLKFGREDIQGQIEGKIGDVLKQQGIDLDVSLKVADLKPLEPYLKPFLEAGPPPIAPVSFAASVKGDLNTAIAVDNLDLSLGQDGVKARVTGSVKDAMAQKGIDLEVVADISDFEKLSAYLGRELPPLAPVSLKTGVEDAGKMAFRLKDLELTFAGNDVSGDATADLSETTPSIKANLASRRMDVNSILKGMEKKSTETAKPSKPEKDVAVDGAKAKKTGKVFPDEPLPLDLLKTVNADIGYKAQDLYLPKLAMHNVTVGVRLQNGNLAVSPLKANLGGGSLDGSVSLNPRPNNAADAKIKIATTSFDVGAMLKELQITDLMSGRVNVDLDVSTAGGSVAALMGGLGGYSKIVMENGAIHNKYVGLIGANLDKAVAQILMPGHDKKDFTAINCFVNRFDFTNGVADTTVLFMDSEYMSVVGEGKIDLGKETLDMAVLPKPKDKVAEVGTSIGQLASNFRIGGTLEKPKVKMDAAGAVDTVQKVLGGISAMGGLKGVLSALEGETAATEDLCPAAKEAANSGQKMNLEKKAGTQKATAPAPADSAAEQKPPTKEEKRKKEIESIGNALKGILGN